MLAHYGIDTLDPHVSLRRVKVLAERLPPGSWPDPDAQASWTTEAYLLAHLIDAVAALTHLTARAHGAKPNQPKPFPRPGAAAQARTSWAKLAQTLRGNPGVVVHDA